MTIGIYLIRILISLGVGVGFMLTIATIAATIDMRPTKDRVVDIAFCVFLIIFIVSAILLWRIK